MLRRLINVARRITRLHRQRTKSKAWRGAFLTPPLALEQLEERTVPSLSYLGNEIQVAPSLGVGAAMDGSGNSIVATFGYSEITAQRYDASGTAQGTPITVLTDGSFLSSVRVAADTAGNFVVAWFGGSTYGARVFNAAGVPQSDAITVGTGFSTYAAPSVLMTPTGFAVFWTDIDNVLHGKRYDASGNLLGTIAINESTYVTHVRAAADASGNFVVVYDSANFYFQTTPGSQVFAQRLDANGNPLGQAFLLSQSSGIASANPTVAVQPAGEFAAAWDNDGDSTGAADSARGLYIRLFNADGTPQGASALIDSQVDGDTNDAAIGPVTVPVMAMDSMGDFLVSWNPKSTTSENASAKAQLFGPTGAPQGMPFQVRAAGAAAKPMVAMTPTGDRILIAFVDGPAVGFGPTTASVDLIAQGPNNAPLVDTAKALTFTYERENDPNPTGDRISEVFGAALSDADLSEFLGIAVSGATETANGTWQFSLDGGTTWNSLGAVAESAARLLRSTDRIRFLPSNGFLGTATLTFHAWDQNSGSAGSTVDLSQSGGTGGSSAFSSAESSATLYVTPTGNYAPVLDTTYKAQVSNMGESAIAQIVGPSISDRDHDPQGIAVTAVTGAARSSWQFSLDSGTTWTPMPAANLSVTSALLLRAGDLVRFVPNAADFSGSASITYRAWDQALGTAGTLADSTAVDPVVGAAGSAFSADQAMASGTLNSVIFTSSGHFGTFDIYGTEVDDTLLCTPSSSVVLNGQEHDFTVGPNVSDPNSLWSIEIIFHGNGGKDSAYVDMRGFVLLPGGVYSFARAEISDTVAYVSGQLFADSPSVAGAYSVNLYNVHNIYLSGSVGSQVVIHPSAGGSNTFVSTPTYSYLSAPNRFDVVAGVGGQFTGGPLGSVYVYGNHTAGDAAYFYGPAGLAAFVASGSAYSYLSSTGSFDTGSYTQRGNRFDVAVGFGVVYAYPGSNQNIAYFLDSPGNDVFYGDASVCYMYGIGFFNEAVDFAIIYAESFVGGVDYAYNYAPGRIITGGYAGVFYRQ